jgi:hypothetical protein
MVGDLQSLGGHWDPFTGLKLLVFHYHHLIEFTITPAGRHQNQVATTSPNSRWSGKELISSADDIIKLIIIMIVIIFIIKDSL